MKYEPLFLRIRITSLAIWLMCSALTLMNTSSVNAQQDWTPGDGVDLSPIDLKVELAFNESVRIERPVILTNAGDGTNRIFVGSQQGKIYYLDGEDDQEPKLFMDINDAVTFNPRQNEEGLLGLAFHPEFEKNGEFFVYYTSSSEKQLSRISRFKTVDEKHLVGDASSEEILFELKQPYWNHNGGTLVFGPDGYLYIALGDGGYANDPLLAGQDLNTYFGKILRIDIDHKDPGRAYAVPQDNPFANRDDVKPEIFAYGLRNVWRMSFDRKTGDFYAADVGQNKWEEVNVITSGGNYGWSVREARHAFSQKDSDDISGLIDPIWEYPHTKDWGLSITGGHVYRGKELPELDGYYLYADYVTGKLWALKYDIDEGKVTENRPILWSKNSPIVSFGETESGEVYFSTVNNGGVIYKFAR